MMCVSGCDERVIIILVTRGSSLSFTSCFFLSFFQPGRMALAMESTRVCPEMSCLRAALLGMGSFCKGCMCLLAFSPHLIVGNRSTKGSFRLEK